MLNSKVIVIDYFIGIGFVQGCVFIYFINNVFEKRLVRYNGQNENEFELRQIVQFESFFMKNRQNIMLVRYMKY